MTCEVCPLYWRCTERRGICRDYIRYMERVERTKEEIERINQMRSAQATSSKATTDKGGGHWSRQNELRAISTEETPKGQEGVDADG